MFAAALDVSEAFDTVSHRHLFESLTKSGIPMWIVNVIVNWYSKLSVAVRWNSTVSHSWSHAVATRSRWRRGYGFNGKGVVGGARKYDGQLLTALCGGSWTSGSRCWDVELSTLKLGKSYVLYIHVNKCISCFDSVGTLCDLLTARPNRYNNHAPTEPLATS